MDANYKTVQLKIGRADEDDGRVSILVVICKHVTISCPVSLLLLVANWTTLSDLVTHSGCTG